MRKYSFVAIIIYIIIAFVPFSETRAFEPSQAEIDFHNQPQAFSFHNMFSFYEPTYLLAWYHTKNPDYDMYDNHTPNHVKLRQNEVKVQFSFEIMLLKRMFGTDNLRFYLAYTQLFFWQLYSPTQFMREVDYEPILYLKWHFAPNMFANLLINHQSNGKGGYMEVAWNRVIGSVELTAKNFYAQISGWVPFGTVKARSHNSASIAYYMGYDKILLSYNLKDFVFSIEGQNIESGFTRGHIMATVSYSANSRVKLYAQYFSGYGQSLIEFDNRTNAFGVGIALSDWQ